LYKKDAILNASRTKRIKMKFNGFVLLQCSQHKQNKNKNKQQTANSKQQTASKLSVVLKLFSSEIQADVGSDS
jgi:hypothetical protein